MVKTILIMGPTASGKSALALALAGRVDGVIINADSMQVYRDLRVLTARPTAAEEAQAPHALYGFVDAAERYSVGKWAKAAQAAIAAAREVGRTPIVVGGTGLYFSALTAGISDIPAPDETVSAALREEAEQLGAAALHARLAVLDPIAAGKIEANDAVRIVRALAVLASSGRPLSAWQGNASPALAKDEWTGLTLWPDREALYQRIEARFAAMLDEGALEEARRLAARGLDRSLPVMRAHGAPWLMAATAGGLEIEEAARRGVLDTRHYAKRQFTWMRARMAEWPALAVGASGAPVEAALGLLGK